MAFKLIKIPLCSFRLFHPLDLRFSQVKFSPIISYFAVTVIKFKYKSGAKNSKRCQDTNIVKCRPFDRAEAATSNLSR